MAYLRPQSAAALLAPIRLTKCSRRSEPPKPPAVMRVLAETDAVVRRFALCTHVQSPVIKVEYLP
jgi:hypothetical protein